LFQVLVKPTTHYFSLFDWERDDSNDLTISYHLKRKKKKKLYLISIQESLFDWNSQNKLLPPSHEYLKKWDMCWYEHKPTCNI